MNELETESGCLYWIEWSIRAALHKREARLAELEGALAEALAFVSLANHLPTCIIHEPPYTSEGCDCGYDKLIASLRALLGQS